MKKVLLATAFLALVILTPMSTMAEVEVGVRIGLPPPIVFASPPQVVVVPETYVYVVPSVREDIFFYNGWWWRPWGGHWYRSRYYDQGWVHYAHVPSFHREVPPGWRHDYNEHRWKGQPWNHQPISYHDLHHNWNNWQKDKHWEKQQSWGVQGLKPHPQSSTTHASREADAKGKQEKVAKKQQSTQATAKRTQEKGVVKKQQSKPQSSNVRTSRDANPQGRQQGKAMPQQQSRPQP